MQNTPDRHPRKIFRATIPAGFPGSTSLQDSPAGCGTTSTLRQRGRCKIALQRPFVYPPPCGLHARNEGCPDAVRGGTGRMGRHGKFGEGSDIKAAGRATGTMQAQPKQQKEQRQEQRRGKTGTAAEATAGRTEEGKLQRKIRSSTYNPEAAFAKNFNNKAAIKSQPNSQIR